MGANDIKEEIRKYEKKHAGFHILHTAQFYAYMQTLPDHVMEHEAAVSGFGYLRGQCTRMKTLIERYQGIIEAVCEEEDNDDAAADFQFFLVPATQGLLFAFQTAEFKMKQLSDLANVPDPDVPAGQARPATKEIEDLSIEKPTEAPSGKKPKMTLPITEIDPDELI